MCKHILNAQVSVRAPCCKRWFDCPACHDEQSDHEPLKKWELTFACKKCKKCFRRDMREFEDADEYCPHCDNHFCIEPKLPQQPALMIQLEGSVDMIKDERMRNKNHVDAVDSKNNGGAAGAGAPAHALDENGRPMLQLDRQQLMNF